MVVFPSQTHPDIHVMVSLVCLALLLFVVAVVVVVVVFPSQTCPDITVMVDLMCLALLLLFCCSFP